jgi:hypothetical protein
MPRRLPKKPRKEDTAADASLSDEENNSTSSGSDGEHSDIDLDVLRSINEKLSETERKVKCSVIAQYP